jgi:hypothetical protein
MRACVGKNRCIRAALFGPDNSSRAEGRSESRDMPVPATAYPTIRNVVARSKNSSMPAPIAPTTAPSTAVPE